MLSCAKINIARKAVFFIKLLVSNRMEILVLSTYDTFANLLQF